MRKLFVSISLVVLLAGALVARAQNQEVLVLTVEGPITPALYDYLARGINNAENDGVEAIIIEMDTPGGAVDTTLDIVQEFRASEVPVIVYVSPSGAQAASAGSIITLAAHASAMAPQTVIGAASPINSDGSDINETAYRKAVEDLKATMRGLSEDRSSEASELAEAMIEDARAVSAQEALDAGLIDFVATDMNDLLAQLDGHEVVVNGEPVVLATAVATQQPFRMSFIEEMLHLLTNPVIISILLLLGVQAIIIELKSPGGWIAGFIGVICLALGLYGLGQISANWFGLILVFIAFVLFVLEVKTPVFGGLAIAGVITMIVGLLVLFNTSNTNVVSLSIPAATAISVIASSFFIFIASKALQAQKKKPTTGKEGLVGQVGIVRNPLQSATENEPYKGMVLVFGELWNAEANVPIFKDEPIVVTAVDGFTVQVRRKNETDRTDGTN